MKLILIGFMGAGKSSVACYLEQFFGVPSFDTDRLILEKTGYGSIRDLFEEKGERFFREQELLVAQSLSEEKEAVIATGGGVVMNQLFFQFLKKEEDRIVFLKASFSTLCKRIQDPSDRPLFQDLHKAKKLYELRASFYHHYADFTIETDGLMIEEVVQKLVELPKPAKDCRDKAGRVFAVNSKPDAS